MKRNAEYLYKYSWYNVRKRAVVSDVINILLTFIVPFAGVALLLVIIYGGYEILMSQGVSEKLDAGKHKITSGIVGFVLLVLSYFIAKLLGYIFGVGEGIL